MAALSQRRSQTRKSGSHSAPCPASYSGWRCPLALLRPRPRAPPSRNGSRVGHGGASGRWRRLRPGGLGMASRHISRRTEGGICLWTERDAKSPSGGCFVWTLALFVAWSWSFPACGVSGEEANHCSARCSLAGIIALVIKKAKPITTLPSSHPLTPSNNDTGSRGTCHVSRLACVESASCWCLVWPECFLRLDSRHRRGAGRFQWPALPPSQASHAAPTGHQPWRHKRPIVRTGISSNCFSISHALTVARYTAAPILARRDSACRPPDPMTPFRDSDAILPGRECHRVRIQRTNRLLQSLHEGVVRGLGLEAAVEQQRVLALPPRVLCDVSTRTRTPHLTEQKGRGKRSERTLSETPHTVMPTHDSTSRHPFITAR